MSLDPSKTFSPATMAKHLLRAMGIKPILERQPDFPLWVLGWSMAGFFGGRAEARIRRLIVSVRYLDVLSMYPSCNVLLGVWAFVIARRIDVIDNTDEVRELLARPDLAEYFMNPEPWPELVSLVEVRPDGDILPVRAGYDQESPSYGIGVNFVSSPTPVIHALSDVVASAVLTGKPPEIVSSIELVPRGRQRGLKPTLLRGAVSIDPRSGDLFRTLIEQRVLIKNNPNLDPVEKERLQQVMKTIANSGSYGVQAEFVAQDRATEQQLEVWSNPDEPWIVTTTKPETPGPFCFPPLAACITASARLMLALLEHQVVQAGGSYAMADTDSMAVVATPEGGEVFGDGITALSWTQVDEIVERFTQLSAYDPNIVKGSILKIEAENFDQRCEPRELQCLAISAKRYALFTLSPEGDVNVIKASRHGLGHLQSPNQHWIEQAWHHLIEQHLGRNPSPPEWFSEAAVAQVAVSGPEVLGWFAAWNEGKPFRDQVKPSNFLLAAFPDRLLNPDVAPIAPFATTSEGNTLELSWFDRRSTSPITISVADPDGTVTPGVVRVKTYGDIINEFVAHPEAKSVAYDGTAITRTTTGLLKRRHVRSGGPTRWIGKESNRIDDQAAGLIEPNVVQADLTPTDADWETRLRPHVQQLSTTDAADSFGVSRRTIERWKSGQVTPKHDAQNRIAEHLRQHD